MNQEHCDRKKDKEKWRERESDLDKFLHGKIRRSKYAIQCTTISSYSVNICTGKDSNDMTFFNKNTMNNLIPSQVSIKGNSMFIFDLFICDRLYSYKFCTDCFEMHLIKTGL